METKTQQLIIKDMLIGDIINKYPEAAGIMLSYGLHCVGCSANPFDTIESGCMVHGMDEETVEKLVDEINSMMEKPNTRKTISVTEIAAKKFNEFMKEENKPVVGVRLNAFGGGCSGLQYKLDFTDKITNTDEVFEENGIKIILDKSMVNMIKGTKIDFVSNEKGSGFKIDNPSSVGGSCGCSE